MSTDNSERLDSGVFRYNDLATELQELILEEIIVAAQMGNAKLSGLASVSCQWQERVEKITFASLGCKWPKTKLDPRKTFSATDLRQFEDIVVGVRREILHDIIISIIDVDVGVSPEPSLVLTFTSTNDEARIRAKNIQHHQTFTYYMRELFRILRSWDESSSGPLDINLTIRMNGDMGISCLDLYEPDPKVILRREDFTELPQVRGIRSFEITSNMLLEVIENVAYFIPPGSLNAILSRLPQLDTATIDIGVPISLRDTHFELMEGSESRAKRILVGSRALVREALTDLPTAISSTMKKLVLKNSSIHVVQGWHHYTKNEDFESEVQSICVLSRRLKRLALRDIVPVDTFLAQAAQSQSSSPWPYMRYLEISGYEDVAAPSVGRCLALAINLMACTPMLESLDIELKDPEKEVGWQIPMLSIEAEYVKTTNRDDHVLLTVSHLTSLAVDIDEEWERIIQKGRGVPLRVSIREVYEESEEDEYGYEGYGNWSDEWDDEFEGSIEMMPNFTGHLYPWDVEQSYDDDEDYYYNDDDEIYD